MAASAWRRWLAGIGLAASLVGCNQSTPTPEQGSAPTPAATQGKAPHLAARPSSASFDEATLSDVPDQILPDKTITGKSVGKLYTEVRRAWNQAEPAKADGKKRLYHATLVTDAGTIELDLWPDVAPNHVRNFVALARAGYYDGLIFERIIHERFEASTVELIEGGCPLGLGATGHGSIGYWLAPEIADGLKHEAGTLGACRGENPDSAACRFYITLNPTPILDGERTIFGKVVRGLDVARRIATQPILNSPEFPDGTRPERPTVIRQVTIQVKEVENRLVRSDNE